MSVTDGNFTPQVKRQDAFQIPEEFRFTEQDLEQMDKVTDEGWDKSIKLLVKKEPTQEVIEEVKGLTENHNTEEVIKEDIKPKIPKLNE